MDGWARGRLDLKPGMTGLWQVLGREDIPLRGDGQARLPLRHGLVARERHAPESCGRCRCEAGVKQVRLFGSTLHLLGSRDVIPFARRLGARGRRRLDPDRQPRHPAAAVPRRALRAGGRATLRVPDGMPVVVAGRSPATRRRRAGGRRPALAAVGGGGARHGVFLVGGNPGAAEATSNELREGKRPRGRRRAECRPGSRATRRRWPRSPSACASSQAPGVVFVALGCPKQDYLRERLRETGAMRLVRRRRDRVPASPRASCAARGCSRAAAGAQVATIGSRRSLRRLFRDLVDDLPFLFRVLLEALARRRGQAAPRRGRPLRAEGHPPSPGGRRRAVIQRS